MREGCDLSWATAKHAYKLGKARYNAYQGYTTAEPALKEEMLAGAAEDKGELPESKA